MSFGSKNFTYELSASPTPTPVPYKEGGLEKVKAPCLMTC